MLQQTIFLVGMMGSGKSRIGKLLAKRLEVKFYDIDNLISEQEQKTIVEIFQMKGEDYFRQLEFDTIKKLIKKIGNSHAVIAGGGGAFVAPNIRQLLKQEKIVSLYMDVPFWLLWLRVRRKQDRPLLQREDAKSQFRQLLVKRRPIYLKADYTIRCGLGTKNKNMLKILSLLKSHGKVL